MKYTEFRSKILDELKRNRSGLTWADLKSRLDLPYKTPCREWVIRMEKEYGLKRAKGNGRALIWREVK